MRIEINRDKTSEDRYHVSVGHDSNYSWNTVDYQYRSDDEVLEIVRLALEKEDY